MSPSPRTDVKRRALLRALITLPLVGDKVLSEALRILPKPIVVRPLITLTEIDAITYARYMTHMPVMWERDLQFFRMIEANPPRSISGDRIQVPLFTIKKVSDGM